MTKYSSGGPGIDLGKEEIFDIHGNRITNEYVQRAVEEVHAARGVGRPPLVGSEGPSPRAQFRIRSNFGNTLSAVPKPNTKPFQSSPATPSKNTS